MAEDGKVATAYAGLIGPIVQPEEQDSAREARRIRLLLVDDQPAIRRGLRMWLELQPDVEIVGEAGSGQAAVAAVLALRPHVVLMDVEMPGMDGVAATESVCAAVPGTAVVVLSLHEDAPTRARAEAAGAAAFVGKGTGDVELLAAIRRLGSRQR